MSLGERDSAQLEVHVPDRETGTDCRWTSLRSVIVNVGDGTAWLDEVQEQVVEHTTHSRYSMNSVAVK